ncbi:MAG TPA: (d)CMP kinase [Ktedonobacteraceae bacterium]|nr:(d)CMP kinase [Ktedonobacteraceae bacterium]
MPQKHLPERIAIDGPAGSGKSTVGEQLARHLSYVYVDTGALYRAVAWLVLQEGVDIDNGPALARLAQGADIVISRPTVDDGRQYTVTVHGHDITWDIRSGPVTRAVSAISAHDEVRAVLRKQQRALARQGEGVVMVGRDIGAVVLPDAELKIYLDASVEERARRRYLEVMVRMGEQNPALPTFDTVLEDIRRRDAIDSAHTFLAKDAIVIHTDSLSIPQVLNRIYKHLEGQP